MSSYRNNPEVRARGIARSKEVYKRDIVFPTFKKLRKARTGVYEIREKIARLLARADEYDKRLLKLVVVKDKLAAQWKEEQRVRKQSSVRKLDGVNSHLSGTVHPGNASGTELSG